MQLRFQHPSVPGGMLIFYLNLAFVFSSLQAASSRKISAMTLSRFQISENEMLNRKKAHTKRSLHDDVNLTEKAGNIFIDNSVLSGNVLVAGSWYVEPSVSGWIQLRVTAMTCCLFLTFWECTAGASSCYKYLPFDSTTVGNAIRTSQPGNYIKHTLGQYSGSGSVTLSWSLAATASATPSRRATTGTRRAGTAARRRALWSPRMPAAAPPL